MKKNNLLHLFLIILLIVVTSSIPTEKRYIGKFVNTNINNREISNKTIPIFLNNIGHVESRNNPTIVNSGGYIGKYQFGSGALITVGICKNYIEADSFRNNFIALPDSIRLEYWSEAEQDVAMLRLLKYNQKILKNYIEQYTGDTINGVYITESGILAAAHLAGCGGVKSYFDNNYISSDDYGTKITKYLIKFSGYDLSNI